MKDGIMEQKHKENSSFVLQFLLLSTQTLFEKYKQTKDYL